MRQVWQTAFGDPREVLDVRDVDAPEPGPDTMIVGIEASPLLPMDQLRARGLYPLLPDLPGVPGSVGVGRVLAGPTEWLGARVCAPVRAGAWAEQVCVPVEGCLRLPDDVDPVLASLLRVDGLTAQALLSGLTRGDHVVLNAATGGVGHFVVQIARRMGVRTIAVVRREDRADWLRLLGADVVLVDGPDLPDRVRALGEPVHRALDGVGGEATERLGACLSDGGRVLCFGAMSRRAPRIAVSDAIFRGVLLQGFWLRALDEQRGASETARLLGILCGLGLDGAVDRAFGFDALQDALERDASPERFGRVVFRA